MTMTLSRREFLRRLGASAALTTVGGCATTGTGSGGRVVIVGAGYGGATAAKYLRKWSPDIEVTLVEREAQFVSCPLSNLVLGGSKTIADMTVGYDGLTKQGVKLVRGNAVAVDAEKRTLRLAGGESLAYDRLILSPGIDFTLDEVPGLKAPGALEAIPHAWKAGPQTVLLRKQLESMKDGGVYALCIPKAAYRCPPGPYERACQVAYYFRKAKPKSKVLILDANEDVVSKKGLFMAAWNGPYKGIVEYRPNSELTDVDVKTRTAKLQFGDVRADVLNVVPPHRAGEIAVQAGLVTANNRWCGVNWLSMESTARPGIHVLGDATLSAPAMPKSGHMANQHGKLAASAIIELLHGRAPNPNPVIGNTCYSFIDDRNVVHVTSVHSYDPAQKTLVAVKGSGGLSSQPTTAEGDYAMAWARNIWADMFA
jgi:sulfide dehydrogenase [flavocytochrome c] flavoprotein chain